MDAGNVPKRVEEMKAGYKEPEELLLSAARREKTQRDSQLAFQISCMLYTILRRNHLLEGGR
jgi:hypothetical protein